MTNSAGTLESLSERIARQKAELKSLERAYSASKRQFIKLARRKKNLALRREKLNALLQKIEADIQAVTQGAPEDTPSQGPVTEPSAPLRHKRGKRGKRGKRRQKLANVLLDILRDATGPMTAKQLADEVTNRKYSTKTSDLPGMIQTRVGEMVKKGILSRSPGQPGVVLEKAARTQQEQPSSRNGPAPKAIRKGRFDQPSLREVLTKILQKTKEPLSGPELARRVLNTGYQSKSKDFTTVVWALLARLDAVEYVEGKGYRLKRR